MTALLLSLLIAATGIPRDVDPELVALAQQRATEYSVGAYGGTHRYLDELNNGRWDSWSEVLGWNRFYPTSDESVQAVVDGWISSPTHYSILVDRSYDRVGCAITINELTWADDHDYWYVCVFAQTHQVKREQRSSSATFENPEFALPDTAMR